MTAFNPEWQITWEELAPSLQSLFTTLQGEMTTLQKNYTIMVNKLDKYQQQVDLNTTNISINAADIAILKSDLGGAIADIVNIKDLLSKLHYTDPGNIQDMRDDIDQCILDIADLKKKVAKNRADIDANIDDLIDMRIDVNHNTEAIDNALSRITSAEDSLINMRIDVDHNTEELDSLRKRMNKSDDEFVDMRVDVDHNTENINTLAIKLASVDPDYVKSLETRIATNEKNIKTNVDSIVDNRIDIDHNSEEIDSLKGRMNKAEENIIQDRIDIDHNTEDIDTNRIQIEDNAKNIIDLRIDADHNTENIEGNRLAIINAIDQITDNRIDIDHNTEDIETINRTLKTLPDEIIASIKSYIDMVRFFNMSPKINFLQEDMIECYPYYHMNNMAKSAMTSDAENNELLFIVANSGVNLESLDLFYAYRTADNQKFTFSNTVITPMCFRDTTGNKVSYITDIMTCDNDYMIVYNKYNTGKGTSGWYVIITNTSRESAKWVECKNISSIITAKTITARYFPDYDTIVVFNKTDYFSDLKYKDLVYMRIYKYSTLDLLDTKTLINPMQILTCDTTVCSFSTDTVEGRFIDGNVGDLGFDLDTPISDADKGFQVACEYCVDSELLVLLLKFANVVYTPLAKVVAGNKDTAVLPSALKLTWDCPISVIKGEKTDITLNQKVGDLLFNPDDPTSTFKTENVQAANFVVSYDSIRGNIYNTWHEMMTYNNHVKRYVCADQKNSEKVSDYGTINPYSPSVPINTPDASPWGKWFYKYIIAWDYIFINCSSMIYGNCVVWIKDWKKDASDLTTIGPKIGNYFKIDPIPVFTQYGDSSCKMADESARYFHTTIENSVIKVSEYIKNETATNFTVATKELFTQPIDIASWKSTIQSTVPHAIIEEGNMYLFYNAVADKFVLVFNDGTHNKAAYTYSDYTFMATVSKTGSIIHTFGASEITDYSSNWMTFGKYIQESRDTNGAIGKVKTMTFTSETRACFNYFYECNDYANRDFSNNYADFSTSYDTMKMNNGAKYEEKVFINAMPQGTGLVYSGPKYGLTFEGEKQDYTYQSFLLQKAMPNIYGSNYTEDDMIINGNYNRYKIQLKSSSGLVLYVPNVALFLGGYFTQLDNPIAVNLYPGCNNYIYIERNPVSKEIIATASKKKYIEEGARSFSKLLIACATTNEEDVTAITYYHLNNGYNDYVYHKS